MATIIVLEDADLPAITEHEPIEFVATSPADACLVLHADGQLLEPYLRPGEALWRWRWNPGAAVGQHHVALEANGEQYVWPLRVEPRKIDQGRYTALLADLQIAARALVYQLGGAGAEGAANEREPEDARSFFEQYYALIEGQLPAFERAVRRIAAQPREQLAGEDRRTPLGQSAGIDAHGLARIAQGALDEAPPGVADELQKALRPGGGLLPREVGERHARPSYDFYEHRLLKHVLGLLLRRTRLIGELANGEAERLALAEARSGAGGRAARVRQIAEGCAAAERTLRELRSLPLLDGVAPLAAFRGVTPLLQRDPRYRAVYHMWQALRQQPALVFDSPLFSIPIAELPYLYETWCALQLALAVLQIGGVVREQRIVRERPASDDRERLLSVELADNAPLLVVSQGDLTLTLRYQPRYRPVRVKERGRQGERERGNEIQNSEFRIQNSELKTQNSKFSLHPSSPFPLLGSLDRHTRVPDLAIEIVRPGETPRVLVFDAKYRLDEDGRGVPQDALADAYAYLGAIGCTGARATLGALLLYPGSRDEDYPSGVGAIALLPGRTDALIHSVRRYLATEPPRTKAHTAR